ncbi:MAG: ribonuclease E activity regulator RraA [Myxococcota bacterium]|nr:ribonuclease E activity regulator RraA [Myxococcota bacterium]
MPDAFDFQTADLSDAFTDETLVVEPMFSDYGTRTCFSGPIATLKVFEDNSLVREALSEPGDGRVLVVDGGGSMRCALVGDRLAELARDQGWAGILVYGCIRDSMVIDTIDIGVKAMGTHPRKSIKRGIGERDLPVTFGGVTFTPGHFLYADGDGVLVAPRILD